MICFRRTRYVERLLKWIIHLQFDLNLDNDKKWSRSFWWYSLVLLHHLLLLFLLFYEWLGNHYSKNHTVTLRLWNIMHFAAHSIALHCLKRSNYFTLFCTIEYEEFRELKTKKKNIAWFMGNSKRVTCPLDNLLATLNWKVCRKH